MQYVFFQVDVMASDAGILISEGGADGVVLGCLDVEGNIDQDGCKTILKSLPSSKVCIKKYFATRICINRKLKIQSKKNVTNVCYLKQIVQPSIPLYSESNVPS